MRTLNFVITCFLPVSATLCHAGTRGKGGQCNCAAAIGWVDGEWWNPWCYEGRCYTGQVYNDCVGQANGASLGDGTWCWNEDRNTECPTETGITGSVLNIRCL